MIKPYSRVLAGRALWMGVCVLTMLFSTAWWQQKQTPQIGDTVFRPTGRIAQVLAASNSLDAQNPEHPSENSKANMPCEGRSLAVLRVRLMSGLGWSQAQADARIAQAAQATDRWSGCSSFLQAFQWAITLAATPADTSSVSARTVEQQLSEDVTWTRHIPCFLGKENNQIVLLSGNPMNCGNPPQLKSLAALSRESSYRQLASGVAKASTLSAVTGKLSSTGSASLTLNAQLQDGFDLWTACLNNQTCVKVPALQRLRDVSVVIMDAQSGALLAAWCHGKACNKANATGPGALGATCSKRLRPLPPNCCLPWAWQPTSRWISKSCKSKSKHRDKTMAASASATNGGNDKPFATPKKASAVSSHRRRGPFLTPSVSI